LMIFWRQYNKTKKKQKSLHKNFMLIVPGNGRHIFSDA